METFRISKAEYSNDLRTSGRANRWNFDGQHIIYTGASRSLSTLELIVHRGSILPKINYKLMVVSIADYDHLFKQIKISDLSENWRSMSAYSELQKIGSNWYENLESLILKVPSAVIPNEYNYLINTEHPDFSENVNLIRLEDYFWDNRLI